MGGDGGTRHADAIALGEADETWPRIVADAARGKLQEVYTPVDAFGQERKPSLQDYPTIPWDTLDLKQFNRIPGFLRPVMRHFQAAWETFHIIPIESGRGCPYGCEFCTVTGFFGDSIRFRTNESIVAELLRIKERARNSSGQAAVFFVDDNFAINVKRTKSLLRDIIAAGAELSWVAQISANLLKDEELLDLIAASGGKWIFIGMESLDPVNLASVKKSFNKPADYANVLESLARRHVYAITSFIFGLDNDTAGVAERTLSQASRMAPGTAGVWTDYALSGHSFIYAPGKGRALDAAEALAGVRAVPHGAHAAEDFHPRGAGRGSVCLDEFLQPGGHRPGLGLDRG